MAERLLFHVCLVWTSVCVCGRFVRVAKFKVMPTSVLPQFLPWVSLMVETKRNSQTITVLCLELTFRTLNRCVTFGQWEKGFLSNCQKQKKNLSNKELSWSCHSSWVGDLTNCTDCHVVTGDSLERGVYRALVCLVLAACSVGGVYTGSVSWTCLSCLLHG